MLAIQYLEPGPDTSAISPEAARERLKAVCERLPVDRILLGWRIPAATVHAVGEEAARSDARLYLWHPLLTSDSLQMPPRGWLTVNLEGRPLSGFGGMPEFTFVCPNRPAVRQAVLDRLGEVLRGGSFQGIFLDRIRFPSPAADPLEALGCFCMDCQRAAAVEGLDLQADKCSLRALAETSAGAQALVRTLLEPFGLVEEAVMQSTQDEDLGSLKAFLGFRQRSVTRMVKTATDEIPARQLEVGLDCFSTTLTRMVGQDLCALGSCSEWVKIMTYAHAFGPAGLPYELKAVADWLVSSGNLGEEDVMTFLTQATSLPLAEQRQALRASGLPSDALVLEVKRAMGLGLRELLAGIELVDMPGVVQLHPGQIQADLAALCASGADGLVLSWDAWHIPFARLELVEEVWRTYHQTSQEPKKSDRRLI